MIKGAQIPVCSDASKELYELVQTIKKIQDRLEAAGLNEWAGDLHDASEHVRVQAYELDKLARDAFVAARRGEELPK